MNKELVAEILTEIGTLLELKGENPFKSRAYINAARTLLTINEPLDKLLAENRLGEIKGIGAALHEKITQLGTTGQLPYYQELKASVPAGVVEMLSIPGLGPKKVKLLYDRLAIATIAQLEIACQQGQIAGLAGFGEKTQAKILEGISFRKCYASSHLMSQALLLADPILENLRAHPAVIRCGTAGSLRRGKEIVGDVDFLVSSKHPAAAIEFFTSQAGLVKVLASGETKASVLLEGGIQSDLRVVSDSQFPFAMAYFTGSKEHNIVMRQRAIQKGLRLNEYGLFRSTEETADPSLLVHCLTEEEIFSQLDLPYIPPELREDAGEFDPEIDIPRLLEWTDLKGSLHNHSNWSDGCGTLEEIGRYMADLGCAYWAITDHSRSSFQANGLDPARLQWQMKEIAEVNRRFAGEGLDFQLLTGSEVDILSEGRLDFADDLLSELNVVVASIHHGFTQSEAEMTRRLIRAAENKYVHMLGHLTGRLLLERQSYQVNQQAVIDACAETGTWIELNASPYRFDMDWRWWNYARKKGVKCVINCDAHRPEHASFLRLGAQIARKGWLTREDVINTRSLVDLQKALQWKREK